MGTVRLGRGKEPRITGRQIRDIVHAALHETPPGARWSVGAG